MKRRTLKEAREFRGLTQEQLAELVEMDQSDISAMERGRRRGSAPNTMLKLSRALRMDAFLSVAGLVFEEKQ